MATFDRRIVRPSTRRFLQACHIDGEVDIDLVFEPVADVHRPDLVAGVQVESLVPWKRIL